MASDDPTATPGPAARGAEARKRDAERRERMAAALRENLKKRKVQARAKREGSGPDRGGEG